ncbi:PLP-dependent transferase [Aquabacterium sp. UBA2148]|uniref:PLP-dependent transferase n=1 Tax=Aquabacterium sp. UBA2148 TaxID=1946042 RepID=UPI00257BF462|nr:PLP-dependent transferase [Aquabacterium sp. UBA2148]
MPNQPPPTAKIATELIHHPYEAPAGFASVPPGVFKASTVIFEDTAALRTREWKDKSGYTYGLHGTPTTFVLEERLATLEGGKQAILAPSGLAAIALVGQSLLKTGDELLLPDNVYGPSREFARNELAQWGIATGFYDPMDVASLAAAITPRTKLVWLEAAGSVTLEFPDLPGLLRVIRQHADIVAALDNTWGAGLAFNPFDLGVPHPKTGNDTCGVDLTIHALTKYPSGGGDVLMGAIITRDEPLHLRLKLTHMRLGIGVGLNDVELVLRGLPSVALRYAAHDAAARQVAQWLAQRPEVSQVLHPALPGSPGHEHWAATCQGAAGLVSMVFDADRFSADRVDGFVEAMRLFRIGYSWGGPMSLVVPYKVQGMRRFGFLAGRSGSLVRLAIGLEDVGDLIADLDQAFQVLKAA